MDYLSQPWHWAVSGLLLAVLSVTMTLLGERFGISGFYNAMCTAAGLGKRIPLFRKDFSREYWRLAFIIGAIVGGYIATHYLASSQAPAISARTIAHLKEWGLAYPEYKDGAAALAPVSILSLGNLKGVLLALIGGIFIGFGTRYAEGCTSGHAINGLSHLQLPSLIAVIGFFLGGLIMTHLIMPWIFG